MKRFGFSLPVLLFAALLATGLAACDSGEQNFSYTPGDSLTGLSGPSRVAVPQGTATFNIHPFTVEKDYDWTVEGPGQINTALRRDGEYIDVAVDEPGTYTVTVEDGEYAGETTFEAYYPSAAVQAGRYSDGFGMALEVIRFSDTLDTDGPYTVFTPTDEALADAFGTTEEDNLVLPASNVLRDILLYHVVPGSLPADQLEGSEETLEGGELMFTGDQVIDGTDATEPANVTNANVPASNGLIHVIDALRLPPTASVAFNDQVNSGDTVTVRSVYVPRDGYVAIHDATLLDGEAIGSVIGVSEYIDEPGFQNNLEVVLFDVPGKDFDEDMTLAEDQPLIAMPHEETNGNTQYNFITSEGSEDIPYFETEDGEQAVVSIGAVTVESEDDN